MKCVHDSLALVCALATFYGGAASARAASPPGLSGDQRCLSCHADKAGAFFQTAHAKTSALATAKTIHGDFSAGRNRLGTANPQLEFFMEAQSGAFRQTAVIHTSPQTVLTRSEAFDIVVGSGRKGQTYLYWDGRDLFQLPISYWAEIHRWVNSPGYVDGFANFERPIEPRCLECHATAFQSQRPPINRYVRESLVLGISCVKCHGASEEHLAQVSNALLKPITQQGGAHILNPKKLSRERQMDLCALCHAGIGNSITPPASYKPGDRLADHLQFAAVDPRAPIDVHANQIQLLERSRCFQKSETMSCITCHDVHIQQRDITAFARQCMTCHEPKQCGQFAKLGSSISTRCVDCHMPLQETSQIVSTNDGILLRPKVRNHRIAVYKAKDE
ncbi:MAG TPA: multiheme c-type cytochrome [Opitutaceae bacterium]|nr:multiheme c-type cytochrome [Opitutaceae bacterium]